MAYKREGRVNAAGERIDSHGHTLQHYAHREHVPLAPSRHRDEGQTMWANSSITRFFQHKCPHLRQFDGTVNLKDNDVKAADFEHAHQEICSHPFSRNWQDNLG